MCSAISFFDVCLYDNENNVPFPVESKMLGEKLFFFNTYYFLIYGVFLEELHVFND